MSSKCENVTAANEKVFDTLTHVDASVDVGLGLVAEADVDVGGLSFQDGEPYSLLHTSYALPTACMSFDAAKKSYGAATATPTVTAGSAVGTKGHDGTKNGAPGVGSRSVMLLLSNLVLVASVFFVLL